MHQALYHKRKMLTLLMHCEVPWSGCYKISTNEVSKTDAKCEIFCLVATSIAAVWIGVFECSLAFVRSLRQWTTPQFEGIKIASLTSICEARVWAFFHLMLLSSLFWNEWYTYTYTLNRNLRAPTKKRSFVNTSCCFVTCFCLGILSTTLNSNVL